MQDLKLEMEPAGSSKVVKIHSISDQEWVSLISNLLRYVAPVLTNVICLGKYTDPNTLHKAYTGTLVLNPLFLTKTEATACDKQSKYWISNIQAIGDNVPNLQKLLTACIAPLQNGLYTLVVVTDQPQQALALNYRPYQVLVVSPTPIAGYRGSLKLRYKNRDYQYFFNCGGQYVTEYVTDEHTSPHLIFSSRDHIEKIGINFASSELGSTLTYQITCGNKYEVVPIQYLDVAFNRNEHTSVNVPTNGIPALSKLLDFSYKIIPEALIYNPVEMKETSVHSAFTNPLFSAALGYQETLKFYESLGTTLQDTQLNRTRMEAHAAAYRRQTVPMIKPTGDQLLAYYKPSYYTATKDFFITLKGKLVPVFMQGKDYYIYPVQHSEVIQLPETSLLDATSQESTTRLMTLHCTYTALSITSELKPKEIRTYNTQDNTNFNVVTSDEYDLARKLQQAKDLGNTQAEVEIRDRLQALNTKRLHITSKDPNLAEIMTVFPPPDVQTLSEAYPDKLKQRISLLRKHNAQLTSLQLLHAGLASQKRGVVFTHNVGSGKTRIAAYAAIAAGAKRIAFIAKSKILGEIIKELRDELGFKVTHIHSPTCIRKIVEDIKHRQIQREKQIQTAKTDGTELVIQAEDPQFYVLSQEFLTIGGLANQTFDPYIVDVCESYDDPVNGKTDRYHSIICTKENAEKQIKEQIIQLRSQGVITGNVKRIPFRFHQHVQECPRCMETAIQKLFNIAKRKKWMDLTLATRKATREQIVDYVKRGKLQVGLREFNTFSRHGHCQVCGYLARSYRRIQDVELEMTEDLTSLLDALGTEERAQDKTKTLDKGFKSALQFPAYKMLKSLFDTKICDEAHSLTGDSKVYEAVKSIHTERTYLLSGTLLRRTPAEMWQVFTLLWGYRAPEFPYSYDNHGDFVAQHVTYKVTKETVNNPNGVKVGSKQQKQELPEPANAPKLWRFLHQAQLHATNKSMGLQIPDVKRQFYSIPLEDEALEAYDTKLAEFKTTFVNKPVVFSLQQRTDWFTKINELQTVALGAKINKLLPIIQEFLATGRNIIVTCKQQKTFEQLVTLFEEQQLEFVKLNEKKPAQPHKRREWLDEHYVKSKKPILLTRTPLINESLNNLVKASVLIIVEAEYVFYPLQQLEGRIARPKQVATSVDVVYMITHHPTLTSVDEAMLQMALRRNNANVELVSGNVTQRTNQELVKMAESQKMREMELMQTLLGDIKTPAMDYNAEFQARATEIEVAEKSKAIIVVDSGLQNHLDNKIIVPEPEVVPVPKPVPVPEPVIDSANQSHVPALRDLNLQVAKDGNLLLPLDLPAQKPRVNAKLQALKQAVSSLKNDNLTLF